jgi:hypothetical protein
MKNLFIIAAVILMGKEIILPSKVFSQNYNSSRVGFAGLIVPISIEKSVGFGMELLTIKNNPGIGCGISYIPEDSFNPKSRTLTTGFLFWEITEEFYIKTGMGAVQINLNN